MPARLKPQGYGLPVPFIPSSPAPIIAQRAPTSSDLGYPVGQTWIDQPGNSSYIFIETVNNQASWAVSSTSGGTVATLTGNSGGAISPALGNINILGATGVQVAGAGSTLTITANPSTFSWTNGNAGGALVNGTGFFVTAGTPSFSLPVAAAVGDEYAIMLSAGTSWTLTQGAGQSVIVGANTTTVGVGGSIATTGAGQTIFLVCIAANTGFQAYSFVGALMVV